MKFLLLLGQLSSWEIVAPLAGAWVEMYTVPPRIIGTYVAPLAGAWVEILLRNFTVRSLLSRSPRGSVG